MQPANFAPLYCGLYPELAELCRQHGYALAIHGSLAKDFDLVAVPWAEVVASPDEVVAAITSSFNLRLVGEATTKNHGRICYTLVVSFGTCFLDFSFTPSK